MCIGIILYSNNPLINGTRYVDWPDVVDLYPENSIERKIEQGELGGMGEREEN